MTNKNYCDCRQGRDPCTCKAVDPVPPAGVEVEVLGYSVKGNRYAIRLTKGELLDMCENYTGGALIELVDRTHVTRLQAEVERLTEQLHTRTADLLACGTARKILQSELTKARELWATEQAIKEQPGEDVLWQVLDAAVGVLTRRAAPHAWESEAFEAGRKIIIARREGLAATAPNQSAPADKGQGKPVLYLHPAELSSLCRPCTSSRTVRAYRAHHEYAQNRAADLVPLFLGAAEQPAPVAVVHPFAEKVISKLRRFKECSEDFESGGADIGRHWFNILTHLGLLSRVQRSPAMWEMTQQGEDCLDEVARLNPIKQ